MTPTFDRRDLLRGALAGAGLLALPSRSFGAPATGFTHGVASGDPAHREVTLWTRFVGSTPARLRVEVAEDERFRRLAARGETVSSAATDFCAKVRVTGLRPGCRYHYRFIGPAGGAQSMTGTTRTLPAGRLDRYRIAVVSCANATSGWFNAYAHIAARDDIDLVVHLGDYIYESSADRSDALPGMAAARGVLPAAETVALADYRARYASYRADPDLAALHARHPMISVWDDHETANNAWRDGARGHGKAEGSWEARKAAGMRAYDEWMPMGRAPYDRYRIGNLATLFRLETRLVGRDRQLDIGETLAGRSDTRAAIAAFRDGALADPRRTMMGAGQETWLHGALGESVRSGTPWQLLAQQVVMGPTLLPASAPKWFAPGTKLDEEAQRELAQGVGLAAAGIPFGLDRWDGYPAARSRLLDSAQAARANLVTLSGDSHNAWAYDLVHEGRAAGVEFAGPAVSSMGLEKRFTGDPARIAADFAGANPSLRWCDTSRRGYMLVELTPAAARCDWLFLPSLNTRSTVLLDTVSFAAAAGANQLERS